MLPAVSPQSFAPLFASKIRVVSRDEYDRVTRDLPDIYFAEPVESGKTHGIRMCSAGGVTGASGGMMFHFFPVGIPETIGKLTRQIRALKAQNPSLRGLLVGGRSGGAIPGTELGLAVKQLFRWEGIPFSVLWGQNWGRVMSVASDIAYAHTEDTWYIRAMKEHPSDSRVESRAALESAFEEILIDAGDELIIGNETFRSGDIHQSRRWPPEPEPSA